MVSVHDVVLAPGDFSHMGKSRLRQTNNCKRRMAAQLMEPMARVSHWAGIQRNQTKQG